MGAAEAVGAAGMGKSDKIDGRQIAPELRVADLLLLEFHFG